MFATYDEENQIVMCMDNEYTNPGAEQVRLADVEDDSSWDRFDDVDDFDEWLGEAQIVEEIEFS